jgi:hypothetical protein
LSYEKLADKLRETDPAANKGSAVKKINNLRSSFRKEMKKVKASLHSEAGEDEVYKPHLWYYDVVIFNRSGNSMSYSDKHGRHGTELDLSELVNS